MDPTAEECDGDPGNEYISVWGRKHEPYMESPKLTETEEGETVEQQSQEHAYSFLCHQGDCSQRIRPGKPNSQFRLLL
jgi:hypothetical protein